ncbi:MAG: tetratricopeptide repeat protein [Bryobacterales bacterium]|nr:tetratricopeptide repeat protein [Bryobacterales bacterium]
MILVAGWGCGTAPKLPAIAARTYVETRQCDTCHKEIAASYKQTGMARAFYKATPATMTVEHWERSPRFDHKPSNRSYQLLRRGDRYFLRRWQGTDSNMLELEIHYVMGSGNAARSYLHRTPQGRLAELPVAWYADAGGKLAMSPGYDRSDHQDHRRKISTDCFFCHNAYPAALDTKPASEPVFAESLPEGIDCQRCHGPGSVHVKSTKPADIVNPKRLSRERSLEVCMQCHLETTSFPLPNSLVKVGRGAFSYQPGQPLSDFMTHFDHAKGSGREGKFEIVSSVYRLRQSKCFTASDKLQCTTCHDPHKVQRGPAARPGFLKTCQGCHQGQGHFTKGDCVQCHMPKRRTEDVVHGVMTDHLIQRRPPPGNLTAPIAERHETPGKSYVGEVAPYYPANPDELYVALAQVVQRSNLAAGIPRLAAAIQKHRPQEPQFAFGLAQAHAAAGKPNEAIAAYRELLQAHPSYVPALRNLGELLHAAGQTNDAVLHLEKARGLEPNNAGVLHALGRAWRDQGKLADAQTALEEAINQDPDFADAHNSLGLVLLERKDLARAQASLQEAIRQQPDLAEAHLNLAQAMLMAEAPPQQAQAELETAIRLNPRMAPAHELLGLIHSASGRWPLAAASYRKALEITPDAPRAQLGLGSALAATGDREAARRYLNLALRSPDPNIQAEARDVLSQLP